jgi:hypothetical protein
MLRQDGACIKCGTRRTGTRDGVGGGWRTGSSGRGTPPDPRWADALCGCVMRMRYADALGGCVRRMR